MSSYIPEGYKYLMKFRFGKPLLLVIFVVFLVGSLLVFYASADDLSHYIMAFVGLADPVSLCYEKSLAYKLAYPTDLCQWNAVLILAIETISTIIVIMGAAVGFYMFVLVPLMLLLGIIRVE